MTDFEQVERNHEMLKTFAAPIVEMAQSKDRKSAHPSDEGKVWEYYGGGNVVITPAEKIDEILTKLAQTSNGEWSPGSSVIDHSELVREWASRHELPISTVVDPWYVANDWRYIAIMNITLLIPLARHKPKYGNVLYPSWLGYRYVGFEAVGEDLKQDLPSYFSTNPNTRLAESISAYLSMGNDVTTFCMGGHSAQVNYFYNQEDVDSIARVLILSAEQHIGYAPIDIPYSIEAPDGIATSPTWQEVAK